MQFRPEHGLPCTSLIVSEPGYSSHCAHINAKKHVEKSLIADVLHIHVLRILKINNSTLPIACVNDGHGYMELLQRSNGPALCSNKNLNVRTVQNFYVCLKNRQLRYTVHFLPLHVDFLHYTITTKTFYIIVQTALIDASNILGDIILQQRSYLSFEPL